MVGESVLVIMLAKVTKLACKHNIRWLDKMTYVWSVDKVIVVIHLPYKNKFLVLGQEQETLLMVSLDRHCVF